MSVSHHARCWHEHHEQFRVSRLAQRHFDMVTEGAGDQLMTRSTSSCMHANVHLCCPHIQNPVPCIPYQSTSPGRTFKHCSFELHLVLLLMSCSLSRSRLLHSLLILLNVLLHPLLPFCFLPLLLLL